MASPVPSARYRYSIFALLNYPTAEFSHFVTLQLAGDPSSISIRDVLEATRRIFPERMISGASELRLRWITDDVSVGLVGRSEVVKLITILEEGFSPTERRRNFAS